MPPFIKRAACAFFASVGTLNSEKPGRSNNNDRNEFRVGLNREIPQLYITSLTTLIDGNRLASLGRDRIRWDWELNVARSTNPSHGIGLPGTSRVCCCALPCRTQNALTAFDAFATEQHASFGGSLDLLLRSMDWQPATTSACMVSTRAWQASHTRISCSWLERAWSAARKRRSVAAFSRKSV